MSPSSRLIQNSAEIHTFYQQFFCSVKKMKIGIEWERTGIYTHQHHIPVPYTGNTGYREILMGMVQHYGWEIEDEENGNPFTLLRGETRITIEGDGKPEISGAPLCSLLENEKELREIAQEIHSLAHPLGIHFSPQGISPFFHHDEVPLVPKPRYKIWDTIFPEPERHHWMHRYMKNLSGFHLNVCCSSENDLLQKTECFLRLSPFFCGVFANSPFYEGHVAGVLSARRRAIFTDSFGRESMMKGFFENNFSMERWIEWYLDQDLIIIVRGKKNFLPPRGFSFRKFLQEGFEGENACFDDFDAHVKTCWTDIRFRRGYLEFRALDTVELPDIMGISAFFIGIFTHSNGFSEVQKYTKNLQESDLPALHKNAWENGGKAKWGKLSFFDVIQYFLPMAKEGLRMREKGEEIFLLAVEKIIDEQKTPAERLLEKGIEMV